MTAALGLGARVLCVFVLLAVVLWVLKRTDGLGARRRSTPVQVLSTTRLGKAATLSVVRVHDEEHVLAVTGSAITVVSTRPAAVAEVAAAGAPEDAAAAPAGRPTPPSASEFLRAGWQVLRKQPVASTELADDEVSAALTRACSPEPGAFAADLAAALQAVEPAPAPAVPAPRAAPKALEPAAVPAVPAPRAAGDLGTSRSPRRRRREVRPPHLRRPRRAALGTSEEGGA